MAISKENRADFYYAAQGVSRARPDAPVLPMHTDTEIYLDGVLVYQGPKVNDRAEDPTPRGWTVQSG